MKRRSAVLTEARKFTVIEEEIQELQPSELLMEVVSVGLCHSDLPTYFGHGAMGYDEHGHMAMLKVEYPVLCGHEAVGIVIAVGSAVTKFKVGDYVANGICPSFSSHIVVPEMFCIRIPNSIPRDELKYCMAEPLMCVANILQAANPKLGDVVAVVGCGVMGLLAISGLKSSSAKRIIAVDINEDRLELAKKYGATDVINPLKCDNLDNATDALTDKKGADIVIEITGSLKGLQTALHIVRYGEFFAPAGRGKILIASKYGHEETWNPEMGYQLMYRAPILHSAHPTYSEDYLKTAEDGVDAYLKGVLPIREMITHEFKLEDIGKGFEMLEHPTDGFMKGIITL